MLRGIMSPALILGLSIHGLAICRALGKAGVPTYAIAAEKHPANYTRYAEVILNPAVNSTAIAELLSRIGPELSNSEKIVLLPTNDTMVREIGAAWHILNEWFSLSWSDCIPAILELQRKDRLPEIAASAGIRHPKSVTVHDVHDVLRVSEQIGYPCIAKPALPLSSFKVERLESEDELRRSLQKWVKDLPIVVQELIRGSDADLYFYSGFWKSGKELGGFSGRKISSIPPAMGQGTILAGERFDDVMKLGRSFAEYVEIDGPIAVEFKRGHGGHLYMIEPNVGRSEYCVDLLIQSGFNLPLVEYETVCAEATCSAPADRRLSTWYDTECDPFGYIRDCVQCWSFFPRGSKPVFPYFGHRDLMPLLMFTGTRIKTAVLGGIRRVWRLISKRKS